MKIKIKNYVKFWWAQSDSICRIKFTLISMSEKIQEFYAEFSTHEKGNIMNTNILKYIVEVSITYLKVTWIFKCDANWNVMFFQ